MDLIWTRVFPHNAELIYVETFMSLSVPIMWRIFSTVNKRLTGMILFYNVFARSLSSFSFFY